MCHSKVFVKTEKFGKKANRKTFKLNFSSFTFIVSGKNVCPKILMYGSLLAVKKPAICHLA